MQTRNYLNINKISSSRILGVLELKPFLEQLTESEKTLLSRNRLIQIAKQTLLCNMLEKKSIAIEYETNGSPYLPHERWNISISHTVDYLAILIDKNQKIGVDMERPTCRLKKIKSYFLNEIELTHTNVDLDKLTIYWCVKEAIIKCFKGSLVNFKNDITVNSFELKEKGVITAWVLNEIVNLEYSNVNGNKLIYTI